MKSKDPMMVISVGGRSAPIQDKDRMMAGGLVSGPEAKAIRDTYRMGGMTKGCEPKGRDGLAVRGRTKGRMV